MKKTYIQPITILYFLKAETQILIGSPKDEEGTTDALTDNEIDLPLDVDGGDDGFVPVN